MDTYTEREKEEEKEEKYNFDKQLLYHVVVLGAIMEIIRSILLVPIHLEVNL